ncbi:fungal-specific transcription factor domain-containing protein, partial [Diaporthe sp. PMI_573]
LPMIGSCQATTSAIMAVAACHAVHYMTGTTVAQLSGPLGQSSRSNCIKERHVSFSDDHRCSRLLEEFWKHKQKALNLFSHDITNLNGCPDVLTFATAVLLALVEVFESGSGSWMVHIEGAKQLLSASLHGDLSYLPTVLEGFIQEVTLFEIFGQTLPPAGSVTTSFNMPKSAEEWAGPQFLSNLTCPTAILHCIEAVAVLFRNSRSSRQDFLSDVPPKSTTDAIRSQLEALQHFDAEVWAMQAKALDFRARTLSHETLVGLHTIWQQSAAIYTSCVLYTLAKEEIAVQVMVDDFISALTHLSDATLMRCLNWPTFIAGAACQKKGQREWVLATQRHIWNVTRCANSFTATSVLIKLWDRHDSLGVEEGEMWDWISELSSFGEHWNFF